MEAKNSFDLDRLIGRLREKARRKIPEAEVEDIVQEVLVVLVEKMRTERVEALQAYAEGILRHMIYDYYQKRKEHLSDLEQCDLESAEPSPEQRVVFMRHLRVIQGLAEENQIDNALVHRHFSEGAPLREVASELGVSAGAVNGRLYRFRQKVLKQVGNCFAFLFAIFTGLWGRAARAYVGSRPFAATAALIGIFSVGSFFSGLWNQLEAPSLTNMLTQQRTRHVDKTSDDDILRLFRMAPAKARPTTGARPAALKVTANVPYKPVAPFVWIDGRDALSMDNTFVDSIHTPSFAGREGTRSKTNVPLRAVFQQYFDTNGRKHAARSFGKTQAAAQTTSQHAVLQLASAAHVAAPSATAGSKATQPSAGQTSATQTTPTPGRATRHQHPLHKTPPVELLPKHQQVEVPDRLEVAVRRPPLRAARLTTAELQHSLTPKTQGSKRGTLQAWPTQIQASPQPGHKRTLSVSYKTVVCTIVVAGKWTTSAAMSTISSVAERASVVKI